MTILTAPATTPTGSSPAALATTIKHVAGMLWYEMLSAMDATGGATAGLGTGADDFQSMFLWNIAQGDFSKYDSQLTSAATAQLTHTAGTTQDSPAGVLGTPVPSMLGLFSSLPAPADLTDSAAAPATPDIASTTGPGAAGPLLSRATAYARQLWPQITAAAQQLGVPPVAILAQSALETGWGAAAGGNNYFGIKAAPGQPATTRPTHEMQDGVLTAQSAAFRDYQSQAASVADYVNLIQSAYQPALNQNSVAGYAQTLQAGGYATDQGYAAKILAISQSPLMRQVLQTLPQPITGQTSELAPAGQTSPASGGGQTSPPAGGGQTSPPAGGGQTSEVISE